MPSKCERKVTLDNIFLSCLRSKSLPAQFLVAPHARTPRTQFSSIVSSLSQTCFFALYRARSLPYHLSSTLPYLFLSSYLAVSLLLLPSSLTVFLHSSPTCYPFGSFTVVQYYTASYGGASVSSFGVRARLATHPHDAFFLA